MEFIKNILKRTPVYRVFKNYRNKKLVTQWTKRDQKMLDFYSQFASHGDLIFDVGANTGNRTKIFLKLGMRVVAIEPQDECVDLLRLGFGKNKNLTIIQKVLGSSEGEAELMICNVNNLSSLSQDWIETVKSSGRFSDYSWENKKLIPMTTLDRLIELYGLPSFIKVDVEGFEHEVLLGLSEPVNFISLEFTPEFADSTFKCMEHLESLGNVLFNFSLGESMRLALDNYVTSKEMCDILDGYKNDINVYGDMYCRFVKG